jgi:signal peptidase I
MDGTATAPTSTRTTSARHFLTQVFSWFLLAAVIAGALALIVVPKASSARPLTVLSGSMEPTYDIGDVVIVRSVDTDSLQVGDAITFQAVSDDPQLTTHRIVEIAYGSEGRSFVTQGDNNDVPDLAPVTPEQVKGAVWYSVPVVGYVSVWLAGSWARDLLDLCAVGLLLYGGFHLVAGFVGRDRRSRAAEVQESEAGVCS